MKRFLVSILALVALLTACDAPPPAPPEEKFGTTAPLLPWYASGSGEAGPAGPAGEAGPAGPAPSGAGVVHVDGGVATASLVVDVDVDPAAAIAGSKVTGATTGAVGVVQLAGDLAGTSTAPTVVAATTGVAGKVQLAGDLGGTSTSPTVVAATTGAAGKVQLAGDLAGTSSSPTVVGLTGSAGVVTVPNGTSIKMGTNPASAGLLRTANAATPILACRNSGNSADLVAIDSAATTLYFGGDSSNARQFTETRVFGSTRVGEYVGSTAFLTLETSPSTHIITNAPLAGTNGGLQLQRNVVSITSDADKSLSANEITFPISEFTSTVSLTATRNITISVTAGPTYILFNNTTGAQSLLFKTSAGTGPTIANGKRAIVYCDGTNIVRVTPDT